MRTEVHCYNYKRQGHIATKCPSYVEHVDVNFAEEEEIMNYLTIQASIQPPPKTIAPTMNPLRYARVKLAFDLTSNA